MEKVKIHPLTHATIVISSLTMALYAYQNFSNGQTGAGTALLFISIFLIGLVIYGVIRNRKIGEERNFEN